MFKQVLKLLAVLVVMHLNMLSLVQTFFGLSSSEFIYFFNELTPRPIQSISCDVRWCVYLSGDR